LESPDEGSKLARIVGKTSGSVVVRGVGLKDNRPTVFIEGNTRLKCTDVKTPTRTERRADGGRAIGEDGGDDVGDRGRGNNRDFGHICCRFLPGREDRMISTRETPYLFPSILPGEVYSRLSTGPDSVESRFTMTRHVWTIGLIEASSRKTARRVILIRHRLCVRGFSPRLPDSSVALHQERGEL